MRLSTIANGSCFQELGLEQSTEENEHYGGAVTPTREVFNAINRTSHEYLAISYGGQFRSGSIGNHRLLEVPVITGRRSLLGKVIPKIRRNVLPVLKMLIKFRPRYIISIDGWTLRHIVPFAYCALSSCRLIIVLTSEHLGTSERSAVRRLVYRLVILGIRIRLVKLVGVRSRAVYQQLLDSGVDTKKLEIMYPYFGSYSDSTTGPLEINTNDGPARILFVGRLVEDKDPLFFVDLAAELVQYDTFRDAAFLMIGDGPLKPVVEHRISQLGIGKSITVLGYQEIDEVIEQMAAADVLVITSRFESFGKVAVEAIIAGTPVVASKVGGLIDIVVDGENGYLCDAASLPDFTRRIKSIYEEVNTRESLCKGLQKHRRFWLEKESSFGRLVTYLTGGA